MTRRSMRPGTHAVSRAFTEYVVAQLDPLEVTTRSMFGGVGLYARGVFVGLLSRDRLYLKVDQVTRPEYEAAGMEPFRPYPDSSAMTFGYYGVPLDVLESAPELVAWVKKAVAVADRATATSRGKTGRAVRRHRTRCRGHENRPSRR